MEEDVDWDGGMPSWHDERRVEDLVKFINAPSKPPTEHEQKKRSQMIERRWRRWATRLLRSYVRTIRRRWRRCLTRLLIDEYREYVRAIPWSRCARRLLLDGRHYQLCTMQSIRTKWRTLTAGYLFAARLGEWRWDVEKRHAAYHQQRAPGASTSRHWRQQLHETRVAIDVFECNWINKVWRNRDCLMHMAVISLPFAEMAYARLARYRKPSQDQDRPVAAEQSATSLAQLGRHTDVQGQSDVSGSGDAPQPVAAEQPTEVATAQLDNSQGQSSVPSPGDGRPAAAEPSATTSTAQLDMPAVRCLDVRRRRRKTRPRNVRAGRIEKKKRARRQRREAVARAQRDQQRNTPHTPSGCPVAAAEHSERAEEEEEQAQRGSFNNNSNAHPASEPQPSLPGSNRQCWPQPATTATSPGPTEARNGGDQSREPQSVNHQQIPQAAPRYSAPPPFRHPLGQQPPPQQYFVPNPNTAPLYLPMAMWPDIYYGTIGQLRALGMYRELSMFIFTSHQVFSTSAMYGSQYQYRPGSYGTCI